MAKHQEMDIEEFRRVQGIASPHTAQRSHGGRGSDGRGMNKAEQKMAFELDLQHRGGQVLHWSFQAVKLRLADRTFYTPDFCVQWADGRIEFVEVKGHWEDDARVKFKLARELHPWATFSARRLVKGAWRDAG